MWPSRSRSSKSPVSRGWSCEACNAKVYEEYFHLVDIEQDFPPVFERFYSSREHRTCKHCGHVNPAPDKYVMPDT